MKNSEFLYFFKVLISNADNVGIVKFICGQNLYFKDLEQNDLAMLKEFRRLFVDYIKHNQQAHEFFVHSHFFKNGDFGCFINEIPFATLELDINNGGKTGIVFTSVKDQLNIKGYPDAIWYDVTKPSEFVAFEYKNIQGRKVLVPTKFGVNYNIITQSENVDYYRNQGVTYLDTYTNLKRPLNYYVPLLERAKFSTDHYHKIISLFNGIHELIKK
jgi:hypothetical protein